MSALPATTATAVPTTPTVAPVGITTDALGTPTNQIDMTDLTHDTSGLIDSDWDIIPWEPAMYARAFQAGYGPPGGYGMLATDGCSGGGSECFDVMPFSPGIGGSMRANAGYGGDFRVLPFSPAMQARAGKGSGGGGVTSTILDILPCLALGGFALLGVLYIYNMFKKAR